MGRRLTQMNKIKEKQKWWQHITNPLHMYCRLMNGGMSFERAKKAGRIYERGLEWIRRLMKRLKSS